jgi:nitronate monooxygenase
MKIEDFLGVELPIIQPPMAGVQDDALTVAVSTARGLGSLRAPSSHELADVV